MNEMENLLTAQQTAEAAGVSKQTVLNYVKECIIFPALTLPTGQSFFDENAVITLVTLSLARICKQNRLVVMFGSADECQTFEKMYNQYLKQQNMPRVDDLKEFIQKYREAVKNEPKHQTLCSIESVEKTIRACDKAVKSLTKDNTFAEKCEYAERRYCIEDMRRLSRELTEGLKAKTVSLNYQPKTSTVRAIWKRVEQEYLRKATKDYFKAKLPNGYVSMLCIDYQNEIGIYNLIRRGMDAGISEIEIYGYDNTSLEVKEVIRYLKECRKVTIKDEIGR